MHLTPTKTRKIREELDERRRELLLRYHRALDRADEEQNDHSPELIDTANDQWDLKILDHMSHGDALALGRIIAALRRLERGTYGVCIDCNRAIARARLSALPEADRCTDCASDLERA